MSWNDFYYISEEHAKALRKNEQLINQLSRMRSHMCGIGTRKLKLFLNKLAKNGDIITRIYRTALEIEDENIKAKQNRYYSDNHYLKKEQLISQLADLCLKENIVFGVQNINERDTNNIVYFELPNCEQISFHCNIAKDALGKFPQYQKAWDNKVNSTLPKLEKAILQKYGNEIKEKYS